MNSLIQFYKIGSPNLYPFFDAGHPLLYVFSILDAKNYPVLSYFEILIFFYRTFLQIQWYIIVQSAIRGLSMMENNIVRKQELIDYSLLLQKSL